MSITRDGPMPTRVWIFFITSFIALMYLLNGFGLFTIDVFNAESMLQTVLVGSALGILIYSGLAAWNRGYEDINVQGSAGHGVGYFFLYIAIGFLAYVFVIALSQDWTITYLTTLLNTLILHVWMIILQVAVGYIGIYLVW